MFTTVFTVLIASLAIGFAVSIIILYHSLYTLSPTVSGWVSRIQKGNTAICRTGTASGWLATPPAFMDHGSATKLRYFDAGALIFPKQFRQCLHIEAFFHFFQITGFAKNPENSPICISSTGFVMSVAGTYL